MPALPLLILSLAAPPDRDCLLVTAARSGDQWSLGPAFHVRGACTPPATGGEVVLEGRSRSGRTLFRTPVALARIADGGGSSRSGGALFVAVEPGTRDRLGSLRLLEGERVLAERTRGKGGRLGVRAAREGKESVRLTWNAAAHPFALVRDASTREVIGQLEGGSAALATRAARLEVVLSDGVGGRRVVVPVR